MKKLICALIGAAALVASATTYIQTSSTGTAPWKPVKDSVSQAHLADSARHAPPSAYADSSRASGLADSAKRAEWAPLDSSRVRGIVGDTAAALRTGMGAYIPLAGSDAIDGNLSSTAGYSLGTPEKSWGTSFFKELSVDSLGVRRFHVESNGLLSWENGTAGPVIYCDWSDIYRTLHFANAPVDFDAYWIKAPQFIVAGGTSKGFLKADGSVDSSGVFAGITDSSRASYISDSAKALAHYGTLAQDTAIAKRVASDTATILRNGISSAITTSEAYATARISDSLTANARSWTTLTAAKSSIHDTAAALRTYIGSASTTGNAATATKLATARTIATSGDVTGTPTAFDGTANITIPTSFANAHLADINQDLTTTSSPTFTNLTLTMGAPPSLSFAPWAASPNFFDFIGPGSANTGTTATTTGIVVNATNLNLIASSNVDIWAAGTHSLNATASLLSVFSPLTVSGLITANGGISGNLTGHASLDIPLTGSSAITGSLIPQDASFYDLGTSELPWSSVHASAMYETGVSLSAKYAPIAVPSYFSTNAARTLSSQSGSVYVYAVSQTTTQTLQDGTVSGETITVKNAQNSSTLVLTGNINAGSSTIPSLSTAVLVWNANANCWY